MTDDQLRELIAAAGKIIEDRKKAAKQKAIEQAKELLAAAGLSLKDLVQQGSAKGSPRKRAAQPLKQGQRYVNPADSTQVYVVGKGRRPKWFADLEAKGEMPAASAK